MTTPALKAMVEAMKAEIAAQVAPQVADHEAVKWGASMAHFAPDGLFPECQINAAIDLEKVARAGLEAIPNDALARAIYDLDPQTVPGDPDEPNEPLNGVRTLGWGECDPAYSEAASSDAKAIIDAILGEKS